MFISYTGAGVDCTPRVGRDGLLFTYGWPPCSPRVQLHFANLHVHSGLASLTKKGSKRIPLMRWLKITNLKNLESICHPQSYYNFKCVKKNGIFLTRFTCESLCK